MLEKGLKHNLNYLLNTLSVATGASTFIYLLWLVIVGCRKHFCCFTL